MWKRHKPWSKYLGVDAPSGVSRWLEVGVVGYVRERVVASTMTVEPTVPVAETMWCLSGLQLGSHLLHRVLFYLADAFGRYTELLR